MADKQAQTSQFVRDAYNIPLTFHRGLNGLRIVVIRMIAPTFGTEFQESLNDQTKNIWNLLQWFYFSCSKAHVMSFWYKLLL